MMFSFRQFCKQQSGTALTEGLLVFPVMVLAVAACVEFGFLLHQWNSGAKAMQMGVRKLIVTEPVTSDFDDVFTFNANKTGELINASAGVSSSCGAGTGSQCNGTIMRRIVEGNREWKGLKAYFPALNVEDIRVTYERSGLGYEGRPDGHIVTVRMELIRGSVNLPITSTVLHLLDIEFPPFAVTATSEDLRS